MEEKNVTTKIYAVVGLLLACMSRLSANPASLDEFTPVDTAVLMGAPDPPLGFEIEPAFPHLRFAFPVDMAHAGDGSNRVFVVSQDGYIYVFPNRRDVREKKIFLDASNIVARQKFEEGLLAVAFHPKYRDNGQFFVYYSIKPLASRLSRFRVSKDDPDRADDDSEEVILEIPQPFWNHNSGSILFGPDGYLYIGLGDGGDARDPLGHGQNGKTLLGAILRIDIDRRDPGKKYAVPKDNPFVDLGDKARPEIWALGFRNIWKLSFDRKTGELWEADVGQDLFEEVNVVVRGGNYGWRVREGTYPHDPNARHFSDDFFGGDRDAATFIDPVWEYHHSEGRSITGGAVYRGKRLPELQGRYLCADWVTGHVWALRWDGKRVVESSKIAHTPHATTAFGEDEAGEVYLLCTDHRASISFDDTIYGQVYRLRRAPARHSYATAVFPRELAATGLFASVKDHRFAPGLIPYDVNVPLWSDGGQKERAIALPEAGKVVFSKDGNWEFPVGTVIVKTFQLDMDMIRGDPTTRRRLETRLMVHNSRGWVGYTYVWNDEQTDATLIDGYLEKTYRIMTAAGEEEKLWHFPSRTECMTCHTKVKNFVLGVTTRQLNRVHTHAGRSENQLRRLDRLGVFTQPLPSEPFALGEFPDWQSGSGSTEAMARAYLDANCSNCHSGAGITKIDLRFQTPLSQAALLPESRPPTASDEGSPIVRGDPERSMLLARMRRRPHRPGPLAPGQMPPLATRQRDDRAVEVVERWIVGLALEGR